MTLSKHPLARRSSVSDAWIWIFCKWHQVPFAGCVWIQICSAPSGQRWPHKELVTKINKKKNFDKTNWFWSFRFTGEHFVLLSTALKWNLAPISSIHYEKETTILEKMMSEIRTSLLELCFRCWYCNISLGVLRNPSIKQSGDQVKNQQH